MENMQFFANIKESVRRRCDTGQVMILSVLMLGGVLLGASALAGLLMVYQIRQANDAVNSAKAFFAADAMIEWQTYNIYTSSTPLAAPVFTSGVSGTSTILFPPGEIVIRSQGFSGNVTRALETVLSQ